MSKTPHTLVLYAAFKKKNRRIDVTVYTDDNDGAFAIMIYTRRLVGNWKDRNIRESNVLYGLDTFMALSSIFDMITENPLFKKLTNREMGQIIKDKFNCSTNIRT